MAEEHLNQHRPVGEAAGADIAFFGHPRGLSTLFFTEMWERFSYYGMRALLILFLTAAAADGGFGFDVAGAGAIYGLYTAMVYLLSLPGGWIADRIIGQRRAVLYGGFLIAAGNYLLVIHSVPVFFGGLLFITLGTGLLKPNISTIVGQLYGPSDARRDAGFSIFYMGINLGAFLAPLACGYLGQRINWHLGFGLAGVGMTLGTIQYWLGQRHLGDAGLRPTPASTPEGQRRAVRGMWIGVGLFLGTSALLGALAVSGTARITPAAVSNGFGVLLLITVAGLFGWLLLGGDWTEEERKRLVVVAVLFAASAVFWSLFEQAGSTLNLFAQRNTNTTLLSFDFPASWFQSLNSLYIVSLAPVFAWLWVRLGRREPSSPAKFVYGLLGAAAGFAILIYPATQAMSGALVGPGWLMATYLLHTCGELCLSPVGLSAMTKLAPARIGGFVMGIWFLSTSVGNYLGGRMASLYEAFDLPALFSAVTGLALVVALVLLALARPITKMMGGVR